MSPSASLVTGRSIELDSPVTIPRMATHHRAGQLVRVTNDSPSCGDRSRRRRRDVRHQQADRLGVEDALSPTLPRAGRGRCVGPRSGQPVHAHRDTSPCCTQARRLPPRRQTARSRAGWSCTLPPPLAVEKGGFAATQPARPSGCAACGGRRALAFRARPWWHVVIVRWRCSTAHLSPALDGSPAMPSLQGPGKP